MYLIDTIWCFYLRCITSIVQQVLMQVWRIWTLENWMILFVLIAIIVLQGVNPVPIAKDLHIYSKFLFLFRCFNRNLNIYAKKFWKWHVNWKWIWVSSITLNKQIMHGFSWSKTWKLEKRRIFIIFRLKSRNSFQEFFWEGEKSTKLNRAPQFSVSVSATDIYCIPDSLYLTITIIIPVKHIIHTNVLCFSMLTWNTHGL